VTLRDQSIILPPSAHLIADALREAGDEGCTLAELEVAAGTRWALGVIRQMNRAGFNIGEMAGRYVLVHEPDLVSVSTGAPAGGDRPSFSEAALPRPMRQAAAGAPVDTELVQLQLGEAT
jgi:hypothetical protein